MAAINFPVGPNTNDIFTSAGKQWQWDGYEWVLLNVTSTLHASTHVSTGTDPITISQSQVTNLVSDLSNKASVANQVPNQSGNTGKYLTTDGSTASWATVYVLPSQSGNAGKALTTDGTTASWGFPAVPQNSQTSAYTIVASDNGKYIDITTGGVTFANTTGFTAGQNVVIYNNSSSSQTITQGAGVTLRQAGTTTSGNRTLASYGIATILCVASNVYVISGTGLA
jgi:hypothetical protein